MHVRNQHALAVAAELQDVSELIGLHYLACHINNITYLGQIH